MSPLRTIFQPVRETPGSILCVDDDRNLCQILSEALIVERGLAAVSDAGILEQAVSEVLAENSENVELFHSGEEKVVNFLMGQVMRKTQGKADPAAVREILARELRK